MIKTSESNFIKPVVLITGTSSGFGLRMVGAFASKGYMVIATLRNLNRREQLDKLIKKHREKQFIEVCQLDVTDRGSIEQCIRECFEKHGRIDCLVNNAGTGTPGFLEEVTDDDWNTMFNTNFFGAVNVTQAVLPHMRKAGHGRVIMISSLGGLVPTPILGAYCATKFALEGYAETLRLELQPFHVDVVLVEPGAFQTQIWSKFQNANTCDDSQYAEDFKKLIHFYSRMKGHFANPEIVANRVVQIAAKRHSSLRYVVGRDAVMEVILQRVLPWRIYEKVARKLVGL